MSINPSTSRLVGNTPSSSSNSSKPFSRSHSQPYMRPSTSGNDAPKLISFDSDCSRLLIPEIANASNTFEVHIKRNGFGLGFSIMGGPDCPSPYTNLIRLKKIFPLQPAWETGKLKVGDIIVKVNGLPLSGLGLRQALDILRTSPTNTVLTVCRPPDTAPRLESSPPRHHLTVVRSYSYSSAPLNDSLTICSKSFNINKTPKISVDSSISDVDMAICDNYMSEIDEDDFENIENINSNSTFNSSSISAKRSDNVKKLDLLSPIDNNNCGKDKVYGEIVITLRKVNGSLGFTINQSEDSTVMRHAVKALVKEPAISDGRILPGDKLISANDVECGNFSHGELIQFLRQLPEEVILKLYRDASRSQTPVSPDVNFQRRFSNDDLHHGGPQRPNSRNKQLRYEAKEMVRSLQASRSSLDKMGIGSPVGSCASTSTLHRRFLNRPYSPSPQMQNANSKSHLYPKSPNSGSNSCLSTSMPIDVSDDKPILSAATSMPLIESPSTPATPNTHTNLYNDSSTGSVSLPPVYLSQRSFERLKIEDVTNIILDEDLNENMLEQSSMFSSSDEQVDDTTSSCSITTTTSGSGLASSDSKRPHQAYTSITSYSERPKDLNLFSNENRRKQGYVFKSNENENNNNNNDH